MLQTELKHLELVSDATATATTEATATTLLTLPAYTFNGTEAIQIEFTCSYWTIDATGKVAFVSLWLDGSIYGRLWDSRTQVANDFQAAVDTSSERIYMSTIGAGSHTWSIRAHLDAAGTFTVKAGAGGAGTPFEARASLIRVA